MVSDSQIPDLYDSVNESYREYVWQAYTMGLLVGVDDEGNYNGAGTVNRAQGALVLYRLIEEDQRMPQMPAEQS